MADITTVTERGQTAIPARLRRESDVQSGATLVWEWVSRDEWRVRVVRSTDPAPSPRRMLGYARRFRATRSTESWMEELRASERESEEAGDPKDVG